MTTFASICSGGEGCGLGARAAGLDHLWGIENDPAIAAVARMNGFKVYIASVLWPWLAVGLPTPDVLHASPPCPEFSTAKVGGKETWLDIAIAQGVARFIRIMRPRFFTLENVYMYRHSESWGIIERALAECGYMYDLAHLNSADFAVPQTRKRMWVRAVRGGLVPHLPSPEPWQGWYAAVEDLIPDLPDDNFAPWQLERMPAELRETVLLAQGHSQGEPLTRTPGKPSFTVTANHNMLGMRAYLVTNQYAAPTSVPDREPKVVSPDKPSPTVTTGAGGRWRAWLATGQANSPTSIPMRAGGEPANTVTAGAQAGPWRAFVAGATPDGFAIRDADEPANTALASNPRRPTRAFVVDGGNAGRAPTVRDADEPMFTIDAMRESKHPKRAAIHGRVVRMTVRCLARWQTFDDSYLLSGKKTLDARIIGNAVPPRQYEKILRSLTG